MVKKNDSAERLKKGGGGCSSEVVLQGVPVSEA